jgi:hypothetical protein
MLFIARSICPACRSCLTLLSAEELSPVHLTTICALATLWETLNECFGVFQKKELPLQSLEVEHGEEHSKAFSFTKNLEGIKDGKVVSPYWGLLERLKRS